MSIVIDGTTGIDKVQDGTITDTKLSLSANSQEIKDALNAGGSAPIYACRAWVNFNGTGTVAINGSGNVTSIIDHATGNYTINFSTALPNANYVAVMTGTIGGTPAVAGINLDNYDKTTTALRIFTAHFGNSPHDCSNVNVAIFA